METTDTTPVEQKPTVSFWEKCTTLAKKFIGIFRKKKPAPTPPLPPEPIPESIKQLYKNLEDELLHYNKSLLMPEVELDFLIAVRSMVDKGITNGVNGVSNARDNEINKIAENKAGGLFKLAKVLLSGIKTKAATEEQEKKQLLERNKKQDIQHHQYLELLQYYRRHHARNFSLPWGILCLFTGIILLLSDLPLSLKLFANGFDLDTIETWPLAVGISLCTIFIKIYYDNYIDLKYGHGLITNARFTEMFSSDRDPNSILSEEGYISKNQKEQKIKKYWYNGILIFTIIGIIILGVFRMEAAKPIEQNQDIDYSINLITFIFLTLVFPVISGICLSTGFIILQNRQRFKETSEKCEISEQEYIQALKEYTAIKKEQVDIESEMEKWQTENMLDDYKQTLLSYYDVGYKHGAFNPDMGNKDKDMFKLVDQWRNKAIARKTNNHIVKISGL